MKLQQSQVWKLDAEYLRIIRVERLEVDYLALKSLATGKPTRHKVSKKVFCRLLKTATLLSEEDVQDHLTLILVQRKVQASPTRPVME